MNYTKRLVTFTLAFLAFTAVGISQKFGHINTQRLLVESPTIKTADTQLETYQAQLIKKGQEMVKAFEAEYKKFVDEANSGTLSQLQMQQREGQLQTTQQEIQKYEVEVQQKIIAKREELYKPILDEVTAAIDALGKEGGYTMIFDTSTNGLLFVEESEDVLLQVKTKLGW